jgi:hypothetical protein
MMTPELAEAPPAAPAGHASGRDPRTAGLAPLLGLAALTVVGAVLRLVVAHQSLFGDELSTYWIVATHGLGGVLSLLYSTGPIHHAEISPPLSFVASWLTVQLGHTPILMRLPSLVAGVISLPVIFWLGERTVGRRAGLLAAALTALAPFMVYYSTEARAYALMMLFTMVSTLALLAAVDSGRRRWWWLYGICACAALYSHYTCGFVLVVQYAWVIWVHPEHRRAATLASIGALIGLLPWAPGFIADLHSPTTKLLSALSPFSVHYILLYLRHWAFGYPYLGVSSVPGPVAYGLIAAALAVAALGLAVGRRRGGGAPSYRGGRALAVSGARTRLGLLVLLVLATPVGEILVSASGNHIFGTRNLAASWPALILVVGALLMAPGPRLRAVAATLAVAAFALAAVEVLSSRYQRPDMQSAAQFVRAHLRPGDVVIDDSGALVTPGPLTPLDVALNSSVPIFRAGVPAERSHPFGFLDPVQSFSTAVRGAVAAAHGHRIILVQALYPQNIAGVPEPVRPTTGTLPANYMPVASRHLPGILATKVAVYAPRG